MQLSSLARLLVILSTEPDSSVEDTTLGILYIRQCVLPCLSGYSWQLHQPLKGAEVLLVNPKSRRQVVVYEN